MKATLAELRSARHEAQPSGIKTFGSTFKNPEDPRAGGRSAGVLLDEAGCRGLAVGGARFSEKHANFVENMGHATTADVVALMAEGRRRVQERFGVELEPEVQFLGDVDISALRAAIDAGGPRRRVRPLPRRAARPPPRAAARRRRAPPRPPGARAGAHAGAPALPRPGAARAPALLIALLATLVLGGAYRFWLRDAPFASVDRVTVTGLSTEDAKRIRTALVSTARTMTTLHVERDRLDEIVAGYPVVRALEIRTDFPHGMTIRVIEHEPAAHGRDRRRPRARGGRRHGAPGPVRCTGRSRSCGRKAG